MEGLLSKEIVMAKLEIGNTTLWKLGKKGYLTPRRIGRKSFYLQKDLDNFLANPPIPPAYSLAKKLR